VKKKGGAGGVYSVVKHNPDLDQVLVKKDASPEDVEKAKKGTGEPEDVEATEKKAKEEKEKRRKQIYNDPEVAENILENQDNYDEDEVELANETYKWAMMEKTNKFDPLYEPIPRENYTQQTVANLQQSQRKEARRKDVIERLEKKGFISERFKTKEKALELILDTITEVDKEEYDAILKLIDNPITIADLPPTGNLTDLLKEKGLSEETIRKLMNIEPGADNRGSAVGKGEVALSLFFGDIQNSLEHGDLSRIGPDGEIISLEVKGYGGRPGKQPRSGAVSTPLGSWIGKGILKHNISGLDPDTQKEILNAFNAFGSDNKGQIRQLKEAVRILKENGISDDVILDSIQEQMADIYRFSKDHEENRMLANQYFNSMELFEGDSKEVCQKIKKQLTKIAWQSYMKLHKVNEVLFFDVGKEPAEGKQRKLKDLNYRVSTSDTFDDLVDNEIVRTQTHDACSGFGLGESAPNTVAAPNVDEETGKGLPGTSAWSSHPDIEDK
jgi:hypothetical protein